MYFTMKVYIVGKGEDRKTVAVVYRVDTPPLFLKDNIKVRDQGDVIQFATERANSVAKITNAEIISLSESSGDWSVVVLFKEPVTP